RRRDREVLVEDPAAQATALEAADDRGQRAARREPPDGLLHAQHPVELPRVRGGERAVSRQRFVAGATPFDDRPQLAPAGESEIQRRTDALGRKRQAVTGRVADEEDAVLDGRAQLVRDPVALVALGRDAEVAGEAYR